MRLYTAIFLTIVLFFYCLHGSSYVFAQPETAKEKAVIRAARHGHFIRIVISAVEPYIQKASVVMTPQNNIKIDFPASINAEIYQKGAISSEPSEIIKGVKIRQQSNSYTVSVEKLEDIEVSKLSSPPRLVIDAYSAKKQTDGEQPKDTAFSPIAGDAIAFDVFVLDAGHGGYDSGIKGKDFIEKDFALSFTKDMAAALAKKGKRVHMSRKGDLTLSLKDRVKFSAQKNGDIFISIHVSSHNSFATYTAPKKDAKQNAEYAAETSAQLKAFTIAKAIREQIKKDTNANVMHYSFALPLLANQRIPAIVIELPNPDEFKYDKKTKDLLINSILKGISTAGGSETPAGSQVN
jgi:N-acetylmuramoyl-L-alanine amidase